MDNQELQAFTAYTDEDWRKWVLGILRDDSCWELSSGIVATSRNPFEPLVECFTQNNYSLLGYETALLAYLPGTWQTKEMETKMFGRCVYGLSILSQIEQGDRLDHMLFSETNPIEVDKAEVYKKENPRKAEILGLLSRAKLTEGEKNRIRYGVCEKIATYKTHANDPLYCSSFIRFSYRQYPKEPRKFFKSFLYVLRHIDPEKFSDKMKVVLIDKIHEYKFHNKEYFDVLFESWYIDLSTTPVSKFMEAELKSFLVPKKDSVY